MNIVKNLFKLHFVHKLKIQASNTNSINCKVLRESQTFCLGIFPVKELYNILYRGVAPGASMFLFWKHFCDPIP